jgi:indolepyruvate decarboxylase
MHSEVHIWHADYPNLKISDVLGELNKRLHQRTDIRGPGAKYPIIPKVDVADLITADYLYASYENFFKPNDIIIVDLGTSFCGLLPILLPKGSKFHSQTFWRAIGWASPASFGA